MAGLRSARRYTGTSSRSFGSGFTFEAKKTGYPSRPAHAAVSGLFAATRIGGCGCWIRPGASARSSAWKKRPWNLNRLFVQARRMYSSASTIRSRLSDMGTPKPQMAWVAAASDANSARRHPDRPASRPPRHSARVRERELHDGGAQADRAGASGDGRQEQRRAGRIDAALLKWCSTGQPCVAEGLRVDGLIQRVAVSLRRRRPSAHENK